MCRHSRFRMLSLSSFVLVTACGGGGGSGSSTGGGADAGTNTNAAVSTTTTSSLARTTTTTAIAASSTTVTHPTTTTLTGATSTTSTSTAAVTTTTSTAAVTTTTTQSTTTTTGNNGSLPPLSGTPVVLLFQSALGTPYFGEGDTSNGGQGEAIGNAACVPYDQMSKNYFVKPHISIFKDGQRLAMPRYIGLLSNCIYEIHNHDMSGVFHVFSTAYKRVTLGELFRIWGQPLSSSAVGDITGEPVVVYVENNGVLRQQTGAIGDVELADHVSITIQIGSRLNEIPVYDWSQYPADE